MRQLFGVLIAFALLAGASVLAVERFGDRELFVSPPDAIAEDFVRAVVNGRYDQARAYLEEESSMAEEELRALDETLGEPSKIEAKVVWRDDTRALADVRVSDAEESQAMAFALLFENEWKIVR